MMEDRPVEERVYDVVAKYFGISKDQIVPRLRFVEDIGADSLDVTELVMELEEEFSIKIPDLEAEKLLTVGQVIDYVKSEPIDAD